MSRSEGIIVSWDSVDIGDRFDDTGGPCFDVNVDIGCMMFVLESLGERRMIRTQVHQAKLPGQLYECAVSDDEAYLNTERLPETKLVFLFRGVFPSIGKEPARISITLPSSKDLRIN